LTLGVLLRISRRRREEGMTQYKTANEKSTQKNRRFLERRRRHRFTPSRNSKSLQSTKKADTLAQKTLIETVSKPLARR
jgi:hypothetical protein